MEESKILHSLTVLARCQRKAIIGTEVDCCGVFVRSKDDRACTDGRTGIDGEVFSLEYKGGNDLEQLFTACCERDFVPIKSEVYHDQQQQATGTITVDLFNLTASPQTPMEQPMKKPLAVDDYFMAVAILCKALPSKVSEEDKAGACIVSNESLHVISIGHVEGEETSCAELCALHNAKKRSRVDLTKCSLYTTKPPCLKCTVAILKAGIRIVVYGDVQNKGLEDDIERKVCQAKACFKKYYKDKDKITIDLSEEGKVLSGKDSQDEPQKQQRLCQQISSKEKPSYEDFFMAIAFLSSTRSKDGNCKVGACLVTPPPHRLVAMGYNGMPDGRGFDDATMPWDLRKKNYVCHAEVNAIIAGFRREADLSACTLYVTHSPCEDCSKLVAQSGIKNLVFATYFDYGSSMHAILRRLPINIKEYKYEGRRGTEIMLIDLINLDVTLKESERKPQLYYNRPEPRKEKDDINFPKDDYFMALAVLAQSRSPFEKRVGACLVYQEPCRAISVGYNGFVDGLSDGYECCAEFNAIVSAFRYHADLTTATLYTTGVPCPRCATMIVQSGIKTVVHGAGPDEEEAHPQQEQAGKRMTEVEEIFYWGKVAILKYEPKTSRPYIEIDLRGLIVEGKTKNQIEEEEREDSGEN